MNNGIPIESWFHDEKDEELLHLLKSIPRVSGFIGGSKQGIPFPVYNYDEIITRQIEEACQLDDEAVSVELDTALLKQAFDILEEAHKLKPDHYVSIICEGFGFLGIGKTSDGKIQLYFGPDVWIDYDKIVK